MKSARIAAKFDGKTYRPDLDGERLGSQLERVLNSTVGGGWFTLRAVSLMTGGTEASVSARLRDLRKPRFGGFNVERRRVPNGNGLHEYRVSRPEPVQSRLPL